MHDQLRIIFHVVQRLFINTRIQARNGDFELACLLIHITIILCTEGPEQAECFIFFKLSQITQLIGGVELVIVIRVPFPFLILPGIKPFNQLIRFRAGIRKLGIRVAIPNFMTMTEEDIHHADKLPSGPHRNACTCGVIIAFYELRHRDFILNFILPVSGWPRKTFLFWDRVPVAVIESANALHPV